MINTNLDNTGTNNLASNVCLESKELHMLHSLSRQVLTTSLVMNVCLELLQIYSYLNLDKTGTKNLASKYVLIF